MIVQTGLPWCLPEAPRAAGPRGNMFKLWMSKPCSPSPPGAFAFISLTGSSDQRPGASPWLLCRPPWCWPGSASRLPGRVAAGHHVRPESGSGAMSTASVSLSPLAHCDSSPVVSGGWLAAPVRSLPSLNPEGMGGESRSPGLVSSFGLRGP